MSEIVQGGSQELTNKLGRCFLASPQALPSLATQSTAPAKRPGPPSAASSPVGTASPWAGSTQALSTSSLSHSQDCSHFRRCTQRKMTPFLAGCVCLLLEKQSNATNRF